MTTEGTDSAEDPWHAWLKAAAPAGAFGTGAPWPGPSAAGLDSLAARYGRVSQELGAVMAMNPSDPAFRTGLEAFVRSFFSLDVLGLLGERGLPGSPDPGPALGRPAAAALGPAREHQQRAAALAAAAAEYAAAQQALVPLLAAAAGAAATAFATRVADGSPRGARASLELWIECAENAWQDLAHGEAWCAAQARAIDAALVVVACRNDIVEDAARLAGLASRRELDELQRRVRTLERGE